MPIRSNTQVVALDNETTEFGVIEADFQAEKLRIVAKDIVKTLVTEPLANDTTRQDLGEHEFIEGLIHPGSEFGFSTWVQGLGTAAGDGQTPTAHAFSRAMAACFGDYTEDGTDNSGSWTDGTTLAGAPAVDAFDLTTQTNEFEDDTIIGVTLNSGAVECRPVLDWTTLTVTPAIKLSAIPDAANVCYGSANVRFTDSSTSRYYAQGEAIGVDANDSWRFFGLAGNVAFPEATAAEVQLATFTFNVASGVKLQSGITQTAPTALRPAVSAGGEFLIAPYHASAAQDISELSYLRASIEFANEYIGQEAANSLDIGISQWTLVNSTPRIVLTVPHDDNPPGGATSWTNAWEDGSTDNDFQLFFQWGVTPGQIFCLWLKRVRIVQDPEFVDVDGVAAQKVTLGRAHGVASNWAVAACL
jgi:hypothetical protein